MRDRRRYEFTSRETEICFFAKGATRLEDPFQYLGAMKVHVVETSRSIAFFCPDCGRIWGTRMDINTAKWLAEERPCRLHSDGSLLTETDPLEALPRRVLERELSIYEGGSDARGENNYPRG